MDLDPISVTFLAQNDKAPFTRTVNVTVFYII